MIFGDFNILSSLTVYSGFMRLLDIGAVIQMTKRKEMLSLAGQIFHDWCHCVAANFLVPGPLRLTLACNCDDCCPLAGSFWAAAAAVRDIYRFASDAKLNWYRSLA